MESPNESQAQPLDSVPPAPAKGIGRISQAGIHVLLAMGVFCLLGYHLGSLSLFETSEGRFASVARAMVDSGDWIKPQLNGLAHFTKPPATYWASALGLKCFGISETAAKVFLPIAGVFTVLGCYRIGLLMMSARAALSAAFILTTSALFLLLSKGLTADPLLAALETWMIWCLLAFMKLPRQETAFGFWFLAGCAMLTKGPVGLLPLLGLLPTLWMYADKNRLKTLLVNYVGWAAFALIGLGWYIVVALSYKGLLSYFLFNETLDRFISDQQHGNTAWHFFFWVILLGTFPWTVFFVEALWEKIRKPRNPTDYSREILLAWLVVPFLVFTFAQTKLATYLLPLMVPCSLLIGDFLARKLHFAQEEPFAFKMGTALTLIIFGIIGLALLYLALFGLIPDLRLSRLGLFLSLFFLFLASFGYAFMYLRVGKGVLMVLGLSMPGLIFFTLPTISGNEEFAPGKFLKGPRHLLQRAAELPRDAQIVCFEHMLDGSYFYTGRLIPTWGVTRNTSFDPDHGAVVCLQGEDSLRRMVTHPLYFLAKTEDVKRIQGIIGRELAILSFSADWGLFQVTTAVAPLAIVSQASSAATTTTATSAVPVGDLPAASSTIPTEAVHASTSSPASSAEWVPVHPEGRMASTTVASAQIQIATPAAGIASAAARTASGTKPVPPKPATATGTAKPPAKPPAQPVKPAAKPAPKPAPKN